MISCVHVLISGRVQGVWYRAFTKQKAEQLGIKGWVRNASDGKVEAIFEGEENKIDQMIDWCYKGPPLAKIKDIEIKKQQATNAFEDFSIKH